MHSVWFHLFVQENVWNKLCEDPSRVFGRFKIRHEETFQLDIPVADNSSIHVCVHVVSHRKLVIDDPHLTSQ